MLARLPAPVRFVSAEPLLGPVDLTDWLERGDLQWVIAGGESGPQARPMNLDWARDLRDQTQAAGVAFFLKQLGGKRGKRSGGKAVLGWTPVARDACCHRGFLRMTLPHFGGPWTQEKLRILRRYLDSYTTALKKPAISPGLRGRICRSRNLC